MNQSPGNPDPVWAMRMVHDAWLSQLTVVRVLAHFVQGSPDIYTASKQQATTAYGAI